MLGAIRGVSWVSYGFVMVVGCLEWWGVPKKMGSVVTVTQEREQLKGVLLEFVRGGFWVK